MAELLKGISTGSADFADLICDNSYFVDKTSLIRTVFSEDKSKVLLITRPRRFGKSLTLSMFRYFLSLNAGDPSDKSKIASLFSDKEIYRDKEFCNSFLGEFPVIFITLKDAHGTNFDSAFSRLTNLIWDLAKSFEYLLDSGELSLSEKNRLEELVNLKYKDGFTANEIAVTDSLKLLTSLLYKHHHKPCILLIDEYDVPLAKASINGYYDEMLGVVRGLLQVLKDNETYIKKSVLTGCLRVVKESVFTGINNLSVNTVLSKDRSLATAIGFTKEETKTMLKYYGMEQFEDMVQSWYDGYNFFGKEIFCAWDVISFISSALKTGDFSLVTPSNYWINTSSNDVIKEFLGCITPKDAEDMQTLMDGGDVYRQVNEQVNYEDLKEHRGDDFFTLLLYTGYLTVAEGSNFDTLSPVPLRIPNKGVRLCFEHSVRDFFINSEYAKDTSKEIIKAVYSKDEAQMQIALEEALLNFISVRDISTGGPKEYYYHGFLNGYFSALQNSIANYQSNPEAGDGYADITFESEDRRTGIVIELKCCSKDDDMSITAENALSQIEMKNYISLFKKRKVIKNVLCYGICFNGKRCEVSFKEVTL